MDEQKKRKKIGTAEGIRETKEERILKKFEETKLSWGRQSRIIKEKTKKKETLAEQGEKYREKNELNTLIDYLNKEDRKKANWTENLRVECEKIKFKEAVKKLDLSNKISKGNKSIFENIVGEGSTLKDEQRDAQKGVGDEHIYLKNKDAKKKEYEGIIVNKVRNNLEFFLSNFAIPLDSNFYVQGKDVHGGEVKLGTKKDNQSLEKDDIDPKTTDEKKFERKNDIEEEKGEKCSNLLITDDILLCDVTNANSRSDTCTGDELSERDPLKASCTCIDIENLGKEVISRSFVLTNRTSNIVIYKIIFNTKLKLKNDVTVKLKDALYFDKKKNYRLFVSPNAGYIKPRGTKRINLTFLFHYFVNSFGCLTVQYLCRDKLFEKVILLHVNSFRTVHGVSRVENEEMVTFHLHNRDDEVTAQHQNATKSNATKSNTRDKLPKIDVQQLCRIINFVNLSYNLNLHEKTVTRFFEIVGGASSTDNILRQLVENAETTICSIDSDIPTDVHNMGNILLNGMNSKSCRVPLGEADSCKIFLKNQPCRGSKYRLRSNLVIFFNYLGDKLLSTFSSISLDSELNFFNVHIQQLYKHSLLLTNLNLNMLVRGVEKGGKHLAEGVNVVNEGKKPVEKHLQGSSKNYMNEQRLYQPLRAFVHLCENYTYMRENIHNSFRASLLKYVNELMSALEGVSVACKNEATSVGYFRSKRLGDETTTTQINQLDVITKYQSQRGKNTEKRMKKSKNDQGEEENEWKNKTGFYETLNSVKKFFYNYYLDTFKDAEKKNYIIHLINLVYLQNQLNNSHTFYFFIYSEIVDFVKKLYVSEGVLHVHSLEENTFIHINNHLLNDILLYVKRSYKNDEKCNYMFNELEETIAFCFSSVLLCVRKNIKNVYIFFDLLNDTYLTNYSDDNDMIQMDFVKNVFLFFFFPYVRGYASKWAKLSYHLHFLEDDDDINLFCEHLFKDTVVEELKKEGEPNLGETHILSFVQSEQVNIYPQNFGSTESKGEISFPFFQNTHVCYKPPVVDNQEEVFDAILSTDAFLPEKGEDESFHPKVRSGNLFFIPNKETFSQKVHTQKFQWLCKNVESHLTLLHRLKLTESMEGELQRGETKGGEAKGGEAKGGGAKGGGAKEPIADGELEKKEKRKKKKEKGKKNASGKGNQEKSDTEHSRGGKNAEVEGDRSEKKTADGAEEEPPQFLNYHFQNLFELLNTSMYVIDDRNVMNMVEKQNLSEKINIKMGLVESRIIYCILLLFNFISIEHINFLFKDVRCANYFLFDRYMRYNEKNVIQLFREIVHFFDLQGDMNRVDLFMKVPLDKDFDFALRHRRDGEWLKIQETQQDIKRDPLEAHFARTMEDYAHFMKEKEKEKKGESTLYICIISPNVKTPLLGFDNIKQIVEWIKLLNVTIFLRVSDIYVCGELFSLFLYFLYDSHVLCGRLRTRKGGAPYIAVPPPRSGKHSSGEHSSDWRSSSGRCSVRMQILDVEGFSNDLLLLIKISIFNILNLCETHGVRIHLPIDMYIEPSHPLLPNMPTPVYCLLPYKHYKMMVNTSKKRFLNRYKNMSGGRSIPFASKGAALLFDKDKKVPSFSNGEKVLDVNTTPIVEGAKDSRENPHIDSIHEKGRNDIMEESRVVIVSQISVGRRTLNEILYNINEKNKILWLCGAFEKDIQKGHHSSIQVFDRILSCLTPVGTNHREVVPHREVLHVHNLIVLNEDIYFLYFYHVPKSLRVHFLFKSHDILVNIFERKYFPSRLAPNPFAL
ncbi:conserved Plasmodium protein, unknown function [Plasmodium ovale]|uniref:Uncharacterized protein n=1 Tax=Plasmodium ovale TaxID=36330 RepID=A0A1D3TFU5_PLAOA|nr:conserved Plasmodium protein, unknown function [Plasmodium ovale]